MPATYPTRRRRTAIIPAVLAVIALMAGLALLESDAYLVIRFAVAILALIVAVFAWQARQWWWIPGLAAIAVLWNPVLPIELDGQLWMALQYAASVYLLVVGALVRVEEPTQQQSGKR